MRSRSLEQSLEVATTAMKVVAAGGFIFLVGGVSIREAAAIVLVLTLVGNWNWRRPTNSFTLYEVKFVPRIGLMLMQLGLITETEWDRINAKPLPPQPFTGLHLQYGLAAVVLGVRPRGGPDKNYVHWTSASAEDAGVIYNTDTIEFSSTLDFLQLRDPRYAKQDVFNWSPDFFIRKGTNNYEIGIEVNAGWFADNKERLDRYGLANRTREATNGNIRIVFSLLPEVFLMIDETDWDKRSAIKLREKIEKELMMEDWTIQTVGFNDSIDYYFASMRNFGEWYVSKHVEVGVKLLTF